jgi:hypothetical protein
LTRAAFLVTGCCCIGFTGIQKVFPDTADRVFSFFGAPLSCCWLPDTCKFFKKSNVFPLNTYKHPQERYPSGEMGEKTILGCRNRNPNSLTQLVKFVFGF